MHHLPGFLLDFTEDDVHVSEGDVLAVNHATVLAKLGPVLAMHLLAGGAGVTVNGEATECFFQCSQLYRRGRPHTSFTGPVRV